MVKDCSIHDNLIEGCSDQQLFIDDRSVNVEVRNNTFKNLPKNLTNNSSESNAIKCGHVDNLVIDSNNFINILGGIVYNRAGGTVTTSNITIKDNIITTPEGSDLYAYRCRIYACDKLIFVNNNFNEYPTSGRVIRLNSTVQSICIRGTKVSGLYANIIDLNGFTGTLSDVYDIMLDAYSGNTTTITNQTMNYDYTQFNKAILIYGDGSQCNVQEVRAFAPMSKLDARTTLMAVCTANSTSPEKSAITFNNDEGHTVSLTSPTLKIRHIYFMNE